MHSKRFQRKLRRLRKQGEKYKRIKEIQDEYGEYFPEKKTRKVSNIILVVAVVAIIAYTAASFVLQFYTGIEVSATLTTCWYSFWTVELLALAGIRTSKIIKGYDESHSYSGE